MVESFKYKKEQMEHNHESAISMQGKNIVGQTKKSLRQIFTQLISNINKKLPKVTYEVDLSRLNNLSDKATTVDHISVKSKKEA